MKTVYLFFSAFTLIVLSACSGDPAVNDESENADGKLTNKAALKQIRENHKKSFSGAWLIMSASSLLDNDNNYPKYLEKFKKLESEGYVTLEIDYKPAFWTTPAYNRARIQFTEKGNSEFADTELNRGYYYMAHEKVDKILGISTTSDGLNAQVKFSVYSEETPIMQIAEDRVLEEYNSNKVTSRIAHFVKYDTGWQLEEIE